MSKDPNIFFKTYEIDDVTLKKMQKKMLDMLLYFKEFCDEHGLMFYLIGGGAIGAVREHGFVPWDDDLDCMMPRPDYERFPALWEKYGDKEKYVFCKTDREKNYHHSAASLRDPSTTFICTYNQYSDICHGLALEFGPVDATPNSKILQYLQIYNAYKFSLFNFQRLPNNRGGLTRRLTQIIYAIIPSKRLMDNIWIHAEKNMKKYSWEECTKVKELWGKTAFLTFPKEWFDDVVYFDFEGYQVPLMAGYDQYLTLIFGDYMKRPPEPERVAKHELVFVDMDHPYKDYEGIYYFPEN